MTKQRVMRFMGYHFSISFSFSSFEYFQESHRSQKNQATIMSQTKNNKTKQKPKGPNVIKWEITIRFPSPLTAHQKQVIRHIEKAFSRKPRTIRLGKGYSFTA
jgi:RecG-like helicase